MTGADPLASIRAPIAEVTGAWATLSLAEIRNSFEDFLIAQGGPRDLTVSEDAFELAGIQACRFTPEGTAERTPILFCHGGAFFPGGSFELSGTTLSDKHALCPHMF